MGYSYRYFKLISIRLKLIYNIYKYYITKGICDNELNS